VKDVIIEMSWIPGGQGGNGSDDGDGQSQSDN